MDEIDEAVAELRRLGGSALARKERVEAQLEEDLQAKAMFESDLEKVVDSGEHDLAAETLQAKDELDARVAGLQAEAARAAADLEQILEQLKSCKEAGGQLERGRLVRTVQEASVTPGSDLDVSVEGAALRNVRQHIGGLEAEVKAADEIAALSPDRPVEQAVQKARALSAEEQLAALKAARARDAEPTEGKPKKPKRTM